MRKRREEEIRDDYEKFNFARSFVFPVPRCCSLGYLARCWQQPHIAGKEILQTFSVLRLQERKVLIHTKKKKRRTSKHQNIERLRRFFFDSAQQCQPKRVECVACESVEREAKEEEFYIATGGDEKSVDAACDTVSESIASFVYSFPYQNELSECTASHEKVSEFFVNIVAALKLTLVWAVDIFFIFL